MGIITLIAINLGFVLWFYVGYKYGKQPKKEILEEDLDEIKNIRLWLKNKKDLCDKIIFKKYRKL
jgi:uncharacterized membrane protein YdjX (TVP38/TMEM64 family)